jgi:hypothetical protein
MIHRFIISIALLTDIILAEEPDLLQKRLQKEESK